MYNKKVAIAINHPCGDDLYRIPLNNAEHEEIMADNYCFSLNQIVCFQELWHCDLFVNQMKKLISICSRFVIIFNVLERLSYRLSNVAL